MEENLKISIVPFGKQSTIKRSVAISGKTPFVANHTTKMILNPAEKGVRFVYIDKNIEHAVEVNCKNTTSANGVHTTLVSTGNSEVKTVEHILSALTGMGIDACKVELSGSNQVPVPDASSETFTKEIINCGKIDTASDKYVAKINSEIFFTDNQGSLAILRPSDKLTISVLIQFPKPIGEQYIRLEINPEIYINEICWARSYIRRNCDDRIWGLCRKQIPALPENINESPVLVFNDDTWVIKPKGENEPVRHKLLDALGDLTTLGYPLVADITLIRPGHEFNRKLVNYLHSLIPVEKS